MPEIQHTEVTKQLSSYASGELPQVFYIWGETYLCRNIFDKIINFLLPGGQRNMGYELLEGEDAVIPVMIERLSTYSLIQDNLVIAVKNIPLLPPSGASSASSIKKEDLDSLQKNIEKRFPRGHFLVMTAPFVDRRKSLFKTIKDKGLAIDCSVPAGSRKADKTKQDALLRFTMEDALGRAGKGIDGDAYSMLIRRIGFDPATLADNLEKLISYVKDRPSIRLQDVISIVSKTRKEPIFELTNAVAERNAEKALYYFNSLSEGGFPPIPMLSAIAGQVRKLLVVRQFVEKDREMGSGAWYPNMPYNMFTQTTMPRVKESDALLLSILEKWTRELEAHIKDVDSAEPARLKKKASPKISTDLFIAPNPKNTYPVYQTFLKSERFTLEELCRFMGEISDIDHKMKTSSVDAEVLLEAFIIRICTGTHGR